MDTYLAPLKKYITPLKRYGLVIAVAAIGATYGYLVLTAGQQADLRPSDQEIANELLGSTRPKLDDSSANKLLQLEAQNIEIQAIFNEARQNPFAE